MTYGYRQMGRVGVYGCSCGCDCCGKVVAGDELDGQGGQRLGRLGAGAAANDGGHAKTPVRTEQPEHDDADQREREQEVHVSWRGRGQKEDFC